jgi:hypothetical protein
MAIALHGLDDRNLDLSSQRKSLWRDLSQCLIKKDAESGDAGKWGHENGIRVQILINMTVEILD